MSKIYAGIDVGTDSIKLVVVEKIKNEFHLLASSKVKSKGVKRSEIVDAKQLVEPLKESIKNVENQLNTKLKKVNQISYIKNKKYFGQSFLLNLSVE